MRHEPPPEPAPPSRFAFAQGVATVFQGVGTGLFIISLFICCGSSLLGKEAATQNGLTEIGWHRSGDLPNTPSYSAQRALTITLAASLCFGMALAAVGLGLQSEKRSSAGVGIAINVFACAFWGVHLIFFASLGWIGMSILCTLFGILSAALALLSFGARRELGLFSPLPLGEG